MAKLKDWFKGESDTEESNDVFSNIDNNNTGNEYYKIDADRALAAADGKSKLILLEPRAVSESSQIADYLKLRNTVVVNLKRVTSDQAKRIIDFLQGTIYAIGGDLQKIGGGIFLCTPNNVNVEGRITDDKTKNTHDNDDISLEF